MKNKKSPHRILWILLAVVVLVLFWAASEHRLRPAYIGIAKLENKIKTTYVRIKDGWKRSGYKYNWLKE